MKLSSAKNSEREKSALKVHAYNVTPFLRYDDSIEEYYGLEFNLLETIAFYLNVSLEFDVVKSTSNSSIEED